MAGYIARVTGGFTQVPLNGLGLGGVWIETVVDGKRVNACVWTLGM